MISVFVAAWTLLTIAGCTGETAETDPTAILEEKSAGSVIVVLEETEWAESVGIEVLPHAWTIDTDGIPDHERQTTYPFGPAGEVADATNSATVPDPTKAIPLRITVPLVPELAAEPTETGPGPIGILVTGARLHNSYEDGATAFAIEQNFSLAGAAFLDACNGHPSPDGSYHYHGNPTCLTSQLDTPDSHSPLVGFIFDGFPVYGLNDTDGLEPGDLDECSGHIGSTPELASPSYHYHFSSVPPYGITCYAGVVDPMLVAAQGADPFGEELCVFNPDAPGC